MSEARHPVPTMPRSTPALASESPNVSPVPRQYVQALETRLHALESLIRDLASSDSASQRQLLSNFRPQSVQLDDTSGADNIRNSSIDASPSPAAIGLPLLADAAALADNRHPQTTNHGQLPLPQPTATSRTPLPGSDTIIVSTPSSTSTTGTTAATTGDLVVARARDGRLRKLAGRKASQFYGGTSLFHLQLSEPPIASSSSVINRGPMSPPTAASSTEFPYQPHGEMCRGLMAFFFQNVYQYYFCVYREYFLRDYAAGGGPYYSNMLLFCICAVGALISPEPEKQALCAVFVDRAESLLLSSLHQPELTTLQSLLMLAQIEIGQGRGSKGWLFCGMACRLTHEMGLHLDPNNWSGGGSNTNNSKNSGSGGRPVESSVDREILRRIYWAAFTVDKQLSLYFGRPPALYPHEADVRNTIRIPYPPEWQSLLDTYISPGISETAFEDGLATAGSFIHQAELAKVLHNMIVDVFENRNHQRHAHGSGGGGSTDAGTDTDTDTAAATAATAAARAAQRVHEQLVRWFSILPQRLQWNQWTIGRVAPYVLHLHLLFHTAMVILHRPPRRHLDDAAVAHGEDVEICYESLAAILRLLRSYTRHHRLALLPLDIVHTLSAAAGVVLMRRHIERLAWADSDVAKPLVLLLDAMRAVQHVYPCITEILDGLIDAVAAGESQDRAANSTSSVLNGDLGCSPDADFGVMHIIENSGVGALPHAWRTGIPMAAGSTLAAGDPTDSLGFLVTDDFLNGVGVYDWGDTHQG
ncbi:hypothetical protein F503_01178 [Ophiostoma piceae UAMH 11346]|uniref:Xylanolytic transcriptional activator regulatory domain-containing protein n=1 Tax=Ophiostoma piceae (strain UAMH 11346) TaxID=1262450 RepID=S3D4R6_OPHP1|nr:hypothetical protein F503_01178 [Ophiostoma piceae UAMH 11346]